MAIITPAVLRPKQAAVYLGFSVPTFWRYAKIDPTFPKPFKLGANATGVMRSDLDQWLLAKRGGVA